MIENQRDDQDQHWSILFRDFSHVEAPHGLRPTVSIVAVAQSGTSTRTSSCFSWILPVARAEQAPAPRLCDSHQNGMFISLSDVNPGFPRDTEPGHLTLVLVKRSQ